MPTRAPVAARPAGPRGGWSMSERIDSRLVVDALSIAIARQCPGESLVAHSDRGVQCASEHYQRLLKEHGITCSMSRRGNCWDNAPAGIVLRDLEERKRTSRAVRHPQRSVSKPLRIHRSLLQPSQETFRLGLSDAHAVRRSRITPTERPPYVGKSKLLAPASGGFQRPPVGGKFTLCFGGRRDRIRPDDAGRRPADGSRQRDARARRVIFTAPWLQAV